MDVFTVGTPYGSRVRGDTGLLVVLAAVVLFAVCAVIPGAGLRHDVGSLAGHLQPRTSPAAPHVDAAAVADKAGHALTAVAGAPGTLRVTDPGYRAMFDRTGVHYTPHGASAGLGIGLAAIHRGDTPVRIDTGPWSADVNVAHRPVTNGIHEQVTARRGAVEWDVVLDHPPVGRGELVVTADLTGAADPPRTPTDRNGLRLTLTDGTTVRLGRTTVTDATGAHLYQATPTITHGQIHLTVPAAVLDHATYPLTIDPTVSPATPVTTNTSALSPAVAFDGEDFLVVWSQAASGRTDVYGAHVNGDGSQVQPLGAISAVDTLNDSYPSVAWNGTRFLVVWDHQFTPADHDIYARRVNRTGSLDATFLVASTSTNQTFPSVTAGGGGIFYAVWTAAVSSNDIYGGRVDTNGALLDGNGGRVAVSAAQPESAPDVDWDGTSYLVTFERLYGAADSDIFGQQVDTSANTIGSPFPIANPSGAQKAPKVASNGSDHLVVWQSGGAVFGARVSSSGVILSQLTVASVSNAQSVPDVAFNGVYLVAWRDRRQDHNAIWAARVATDGTVQDPNGFLVEPGTETGGLSGPSVAAAPGGKWAIDYDNATSAGIAQRTVAPK